MSNEEKMDGIFGRGAIRVTLNYDNVIQVADADLEQYFQDLKHVRMQKDNDNIILACTNCGSRRVSSTSTASVSFEISFNMLNILFIVFFIMPFFFIHHLSYPCVCLELRLCFFQLNFAYLNWTYLC